MKPNLKDFPKTWIQYSGKNREIATEVSQPENVLKWKEDFEAELRKMKFVLERQGCLTTIDIKEILGDE